MSDSRPNLDPKILQARWVLGGIEPEQFVDLAVEALKQGFDGSALAQIAGLSQPTSRDLGDLPARVFADWDLKPIDRDAAIELLLASGEPPTHPVISALRENFPEFSARWKKHVAWWGGNAAGAYNDMAEFVLFVVEDMYEKGHFDQTRRIFELLKELLTDADEEARNLIGLGFFETLQTFASHRPGGNESYVEFFGPLSKQIWAELQTMWAGKSSLMDVIRAERQKRNPT